MNLETTLRILAVIPKLHRNEYPARQAAADLGVAQGVIEGARKIVARATPEELEALKSGKIGLWTLHAKFYKPAMPTGNQRAARVDRAHENNHVVATFRQGLEALTSLPRPEDVAALCLHGRRRMAVNDKLTRALEWLKGFEHELEQAP